MAMSQHQIQYNMLHLFGEYILKSHPNIAWAGITSENRFYRPDCSNNHSE